MEIQDIINKTNLQQAEMEFVVESYIKEKTGKEVKINIMNHPILRAMPKEFMGLAGGVIIQKELQLLDKAYLVACEYFFKKFDDNTSPNT